MTSREPCRQGSCFAGDDSSSHDERVERARAAANRLTFDEVRAGFIASLTSRRLDLRSALSSYIVARSLPSHTFDADSRGPRCPVCDLSGCTNNLNVLNFERFKWGGVRKLDVSYVAFDLEQFERAPRLMPTRSDFETLEGLIVSIRACPPATTATQLANALKVIPGNRDERKTPIDSLGIASILDTRDHPGFLREFIPAPERRLPNRHFIDSAYPACWWTAAEGINDAALTEVLMSAH